MAIIKPFRALRPSFELAKKVSCVPYDVVYESEVREFIKDNPLSFLRVTRAEAEFPENSHTPAAEVHERGRQNLQKFISDNTLTEEPDRAIYVYRLKTDKHEQTGVVACCSLDEYESGLIKKHEKTRPDKVEDRTEHMVTLRAQTGLIFLAFRGTPEIRRLIDETVAGDPIFNFHCPGGIKQTVWRAKKTDAFIAAFEQVPDLYIADGHHRIESAEAGRNILSAQNPNHTGAEDYNYVVAGMFPAEDLQIMAYNRVVKDLNGLSEAEFFEKLRENFIVSETDDKIPHSHGEVCMYLNRKWYRLMFNVQFFREPGPIERLDVSILQDYILHPILGIDDPRTDRRIGFVGGARGTDELEKHVDSGAVQVAFSMFPTTMDDLFAVSDIGEIMPPKSTWFEPKLRDGLLVHQI